MSVLEELVKLEQAWAEEVAQAVEDGLPEDSHTMQLLRKSERHFRQEVADLEKKAAEIVRRFRL